MAAMLAAKLCCKGFITVGFTFIPLADPGPVLEFTICGLPTLALLFIS